MALDLYSTFQDLLRTRKQIDRRLVFHGISVDGRKIQWPDNQRGQVSLVEALAQGNLRLTAALDDLERDEKELDDNISSDLTLRRITHRVTIARPIALISRA
jgi:hypothetical protein